jgi:molecular chaperone GrpE
MSTEDKKDIESTEYMFDVGVDESIDESIDGLPQMTLSEPITALEEQIGLLKDQLIRAHAEMENVRRRAAEDVSKAHKFSIERFANELLPVQESLEKALSDNTGDLSTLREGVELTQKQLTNALEKSGVLAIDPKGEKFDPHYHQAISMVPAADAEPNTVIEVLQKGYKIADRVLRPALVIVAQG